MPDGSTYQITGGTLSGDGANLFHSFEQFGLTAAEVANFLADPSVQNILGRVVGGNASVINGLVQVSGSSANLYLLNPAGILFGPNSALNLEGSFTATTASGLGFGENWLQAMGDTNYAVLTGNPTAFAFGSEPGALVNVGNLTVKPGEVITLASGSVINLGTLTAPGGQIIVLAVPGENRVSIRPEGAILSLELATLPEGASPTAPLPFSPLDIPSLLRAGQPEVATGIAVNPDGTVSLPGSSATLPTTPGTALVSGTLDVAGETGGTVQVLGDRIAVTAATTDASGTQGGGQILIGGEYQGGGATPTSDRTYVDASSTLRADALASGDGGEVILWADEGTRFDGTITARGGATAGNGGFVEVSGRNTLAFNGTVDVSAAQGDWGTLLLDPTNITISAAASSPGVDAALPDIFAADLPGNVTINSAVLENQAGNITLEATNNIAIDPGLSLNFVPGGSITFTADANGDLTGAFTMDTIQAINARGTDTTNGRDITISGALVTVGAINTNVPIVGPVNNTNAGNIAITSTNGGIATGNLDTRICNSFFCTGNAGDITLSATGGGIATGNLTAYGANGAGGAVSLTTNLGNIVTGDIFTDSFGPGGNVTIATTSGDVTVNEVDAVSGQSTAGNIQLRADNGLLQVNDDITARTNTGTAGNITLVGNEIDLLGASVRSQGALVIEPGSTGQAIVLGGPGDTGPGALDLDVTDLATLANGFSAITIGRSDNTGDINLVGTATFSDPTTLITLGSIDTATGSMLSGIDDASLSLLAGAGVNIGEIGEITTAGRSVVIEGDRDGNGEGSVTVAQPITTGGGDITITGASTTDRAIFIDSQGALNSQGGNISLTGTGLSEGIISFAPITSGGGAITFAGTSNGGTGIRLDVLAGSVDSGGGDITMTGTGAAEGIFTLVPINSQGGNITLTGTSTATTGTLQGITIQGAVDSQGGAITLTGTSASGHGILTTAVPINSGSGDITFTGTSTGTGIAPGIEVRGAIDSQGGAISFTGNSAGAPGILTASGAPITSGGGSISLTGSSTGTDPVFDRGIETQGSIDSDGGAIAFTGTSANAEGLITFFGPITSGGGDITFIGTGSGASATGVSLASGTLVDAEGSNLTLTGSGATAGIVTFGGTTLESRTGDLTLITDNPQLGGAVSGTGGLQIQPLTPSLAITLGGTGNPAITFLNQDEINQLGDGFSSRTIGQRGNTGPITLEPFTLASPLTIAGGVLTGPNQDTSFAAAPNGSLEVGGFGATLRLLNPTEIIGGTATNTVLGGAADDTFTVISDSTGQFANITFSNISAFDGGAGFDTVAGTGADDYFVVTSSSGGYTQTSSSPQDISFTNIEAIATGGGAQDVVDLMGVPLDLAVSGGSGTLYVASQGSVTLNANVTTPGDLVISASAGDVAQTSGEVTVGGNTSLGAPVNISLGGNNDFNTVTVTAAQNVTLRDRNNLQLNDLTFSGGLQVTAGGDLTAADIIAPGAPIALDAGGAITTGNLNSSGSTGGSVRLQADRIQVSTINTQGTTSGGAITVLTPSTFQALGSFIDQNGIAASLSTAGGSRGGAITLGYGASTFTLGDPSVNGTLAAITTGDVTLLPDLANPILGSRIFGRGLPGQVQFIAFGEIPIEIEPPPDDIDPVPDPEQPLEILDEDSPVFLTSAGDILGQEQFSEAEDSANSDFAGYFGDLAQPPRSVSLAQAQATLRNIAAQTGEVPAFVYMRLNRSAKPGEGGVELLLITPEGEPSQVRVLNATVEGVLKAQEQLRRQITNPSLTNNTAYLAAAQQLYGWLIAPIEAELKAAEIDTIGFIMDANLRTLPLAALHNGERFLVEDYSVGLIPSLGLIDPTYVDLNRQNSTLLVSGASQFINQPPLLAAEVEMSALQALWPSTKVAEANFTVANLQRDRRQAQIIHMATHAQFLRGAPDNSYLQFFDSRLRLNRVPELGWFDPQVELVTLSACQTAMGNADAELGFAGFALLAGAKSALASLWKVSDEATAGLMVTFYQSLDAEAIKAEALRQAQLAMIRGEVHTESGQLIWPGGALTLPPDLLVDGRQDLSHPFYWAAFTMVGSPW